MLITRPNHDVTTNYLFHWSKHIISTAKKKKNPVIDLAGKRANRKEFTSVIEKRKPKFIVMNGHGDEKIVTGFDNEILVQAGKNESLFNGKVVFARSCRSAKILGSKSVKSGCTAYIGYDNDFVFCVEDDKNSRPLQDNTAALFLEPSNQVAISILKGHSPNDAHNKSRDLFKRNIQKLTTSTVNNDDAQLVPYLVWDYLHQVFLEK